MELRARRAFGGIMDRVTGRKAYGLGSIFKSVKKAASKVLSSDIGKAGNNSRRCILLWWWWI
jgi:hypothetical protein